MIITGPSLDDPGGVASYYNAVLPHLRRDPRVAVEYLEIGSTHRRGGALYPLADQWMLRRTLAKRRASVIVINASLDLKSFLRDGLFIRQAKEHGLAVIVFFRGWDERFAQQVRARWRWFFRQTYLRADLFIVLASAFRDQLRAWDVAVPIELATTTIDTALVERFSLQKKQTRPHAMAPMRVLFLARLLKEKGVLETVEAVVALRREGHPIALTIAGDGPVRGAVERLVVLHDPERTYLETAGDVRGRRKRDLFESHDVYCFPTYSEGMPNSVLEAMAFGLPVITCPTGGLCDFFEDGKMGYFVQPQNVRDVARALSRLISSRALRNEIGAYNHDYALRTFLAPIAAQRLVSIVEMAHERHQRT